VPAGVMQAYSSFDRDKPVRLIRGIIKRVAI
jgi:hypothetical protein